MKIALIAERLRDTRERARLTREQLAAQSKVSAETIANYELERAGEPSAIKLGLLAEALDVSVDYLLGRSEDARGLVTEDLPRKALILDSDTVDRIRSAKTEEDIGVLVDWNPPMVAWWFQVPAGARVVSPRELASLQEELVKHMAKVAKKTVTEWTRQHPPSRRGRGKA